MATLKQRMKAATKNKYIVYGFVGAPLVLLLVSLLMRCASAAFRLARRLATPPR